MKSLSLYTQSAEELHFKIPLVINDSTVTMESDTGAAVTIVSKKHFREDFDNSPLRKSELLLTTYSGDQLTVLDTMDAVVQYEQQRRKLPLTVVR